MAISITALDPAKNETNVPVASDITLTLESDSADLDVQSVRFFINGVEVQPSAYYGASNTEVNVSFFPKRKIKYATRRYGQDDVRYGQRDIFPSVFQYGYRYVCTIEIQDEDGLVFTENFSFVIEDGIFYTSKDISSFYYSQTQAVANYTPPWAKARYDKYSNLQQFINAPGKFLQEVEDSLFRQASGYYVQTANLNDLSTLHKVELGGDFTFQTTVLDDGTTLQIPPEISAIKDVTKYEPLAEFRNDLKSFYFDKLPDRLDETKTTIESLEIYPKTEATQSLLTLDYKLERPGYITISIEDGTKFTQFRNNEYSFSFCRIIGESRERKRQTEDLVLIDNDVYYTTKLWRSIESIQFVNLPDDSGVNFTIDHARPVGAFVADSYRLVNTSDEDKSTFWKTIETTYGTVLQQWVILSTNPEDIISSLGAKDLLSEFELLDTDGVTNLNLLDIESDPFSHFMYGIDQEYLYIFDKREEYSAAVKEMPETNGIADFVIDLDVDELGRGDSVKTMSMSGIQKTLGKEIARYRLSVLKPDGVIDYLLADGTTTTDKDLGSNLGDSNAAQFQTGIFLYDMDILGDYVITLEAIYRDGTVSRDSKIARLHTKTALAKYKLERIFNGAAIERMFIDFDFQLKILDENNELHTIKFARDNMLIDYGNAIVYFNENYDEVEI